MDRIRLLGAGRVEVAVSDSVVRDELAGGGLGFFLAVELTEE